MLIVLAQAMVLTTHNSISTTLALVTSLNTFNFSTVKEQVVITLAQIFKYSLFSAETISRSTYTSISINQIKYSQL